MGGVVVAGTVVVVGVTNAVVVVTSGVGVALPVGPEMKENTNRLKKSAESLYYQHQGISLTKCQRKNEFITIPPLRNQLTST